VVGRAAADALGGDGSGFVVSAPRLEGSAISSILEFIVRICSSSRCDLSWTWSDLRGRRGI
jgi:hypothetical protein